MGLILMATGCNPPNHGAPQTFVITATGGTNEPRPTLGQEGQHLLQAAAGQSADAKAYVLLPGHATPEVVELTPLLSDGSVDYGVDAEKREADAVRKIENLISEAAAPGPVDAVATVDRAARVTKGPATLLLITSGLSVHGAVDERRLGFVADPKQIFAGLREEDALANLTGWKILVSSFGATMLPQAPLSQFALTRLEGQWMAICHATSATSCRIDDAVVPAKPSRSKVPEPTIAIPAVRSIVSRSGRTATIIPTGILGFNLNSPNLDPATADPVLQPLVNRAMRYHFKVSVVATASPEPYVGNQELSNERAANTADRMETLGLPAGQVVQVQGLGTAGRTLSACMVDGFLSEDTCSLFRVVTITEGPPS